MDRYKIINLDDIISLNLVENRNLLPTKELELRTSILEKDVQDIKQDNKTIKMDLKKVMNNFIACIDNVLLLCTIILR